MSLALLTGRGARPAEPRNPAGRPRWAHAALRGRVRNTVPSGRAHPATTQEPEV